MDVNQDTGNAPRVILSRLDANYFTRLTVIAQMDDNTVPASVTATVLFGGYPVAAVTTDGADGEEYRMYPLLDNIESRNGGHNQAYLAFLIEIGTLSDENAIQKYMDGEYAAIEDAFDEYGDDGRAWTAFLGEMTAAIYGAYPDITTIPKGL